MAVDDIQLVDMFQRKRIKVTLQTSSYFGVVQRINPNKTLVLADVVHCGSGSKLPGSKLFFGREIINVEFAEEAKPGGGHVHNTSEDQLNAERFQPCRKDDDQDEFISFVVVNEFHDKFGSAVMHIKKQCVIGVGADGADVFDRGRLSWLKIATNKRVYLFDILLLGAQAFKNGLAMILENKRILKVIHDCRAIAGCLIAHFGVKLTNVFDTQVADVMSFYSETGGFLPDRVSTLQEVLSLHLKVPSSQNLSLETKSKLTKEEREMWCKRPCPVPLLKVMALSVIHLLPLRLVLLDTLMTDFMALVDSYLDSSYYDPDKVEHISMETMLELPKELMQLEQMHHERRERASKHYPITKRGLLERFNSLTSQSQTLPAAEEQPQEDSVEPTPVQSPSTTQANIRQHSPMNPKSSALSVPCVDVPTSPRLPAQVSDPRKQVLPVNNPSVDLGVGHTEVLMNAAGRGRPFGKKQPAPSSLPAIGRGFLLQIAPAHIAQESRGVRKGGLPGRIEAASTLPSITPSQDIMPQLAIGPTVLSKVTSSLREQYLPSSLSQSFHSFRY